MNYRRTYHRILNLKRKLFRNPVVEALHQELFVVNVLCTRVFTRMTLPNQIMSLAKLIVVFRRDYGRSPRRLMKVLFKMNKEMNDTVIRNWDESYNASMSVDKQTFVRTDTHD